MEKDEESGSPGWSASFFMQTTEDVARAVAAAAAAVHSPRPSVVYSSKAESSSQLQRLQHHVSRILKGLSSSPEVQRDFQSSLGVSAFSLLVEPTLEPQVLFVYPPEKQLPLKYKDLLSFCFPAGVEVNAVERTPSMSELNEILLDRNISNRAICPLSSGCR
ncbi:hypothetical protein Salat_1044600 [Sesamum alatum]|uniref:Uncharacterized protein n=1 Tax=Sesamum alatum TaxID=300844 RepID=A0AAE1YM08_9LAMI|nr:hypothetical protein Salat_1044600 [Sesamum alatum]